MSWRRTLAAARARELRARADARGVSVAAQQVDDDRARREETAARAAAMGVSEAELARAGRTGDAAVARQRDVAPARSTDQARSLQVLEEVALAGLSA